MRRSGLDDSYVQTIATRGLRADGPINEWEPTLIINAIPYFEIVAPEVAARGLRVRISSVRNVPIQSVDAKIKTFNRLHSYLARLEALDAGADDAIMLDLEGYVTEGRGANVFIVRRPTAVHTSGRTTRRDHPRNRLRVSRPGRPAGERGAADPV